MMIFGLNTETHFIELQPRNTKFLQHGFLSSLSSNDDPVHVTVTKCNTFQRGTVTSRQAQIEARNGPPGQFDGFIVQPKTGEIIHLILQWGHMWDCQRATVPASVIDLIEGDAIYLKINGSDLACK